MKRVVAAGAAVLVLAPSSTAADRSTAAKPALRLVRAAPLKVGGAHFRRFERVTVKIVAPIAASKRVTAGSSGSFATAFPAVTLDRCDALLVQATGSRGSRASLKRAQPTCPPTLRRP